MSKSDIKNLTSEQGNILEAFSCALGREAHVLTRHPGLMWQRLYNRLEWVREPVTRTLEPELHRRNTRGAVPWLRIRTRLRESEALIRTLAGHTKSIIACAISPDGVFVVSASDDQTLKVWDAATGAERGNLAPAGVLLCLALHPFSPLTVCGDLAGILHIVDLLGLEYDPIIVTATLKKNWFKKKHLMRCPACQQEHPIKQE